VTSDCKVLKRGQHHANAGARGGHLTVVNHPHSRPVAGQLRIYKNKNVKAKERKEKRPTHLAIRWDPTVQGNEVCVLKSQAEDFKNTHTHRSCYPRSKAGHKTSFQAQLQLDS